LAEKEEEHRHWHTIGHMAATVAHEVRNPLNTLKMIAQRLRREFTIAEDEQQDFEEMVDLLSSESERVNRVVTEFLELGRPLKLEFQTLKVARVVSEAVMPLKLRAEQEDKVLQVENNCERDIRLDRGRFSQIVTNLVNNALDAVDTGGVVTISASCDAENLHVQVIDNGPGMSQEHLDSVMKPFFTTKSKGTGLGLPLTRRLVEAHDGQLDLSSELGQGTRADLVLPLKKNVEVK
jgi:signal transduction histidine kinase